MWEACVFEHLRRPGAPTSHGAPRWPGAPWRAPARPAPRAPTPPPLPPAHSLARTPPRQRAAPPARHPACAPPCQRAAQPAPPGSAPSFITDCAHDLPSSIPGQNRRRIHRCASVCRSQVQRKPSVMHFTPNRTPHRKSRFDALGPSGIL